MLQVVCSLMLPGTCCIYFSNPIFIMISTRAPVTTRIVVAFIPQFFSISISRSFYFDRFSVTLIDKKCYLQGGSDISISSFCPV